MAKLTLFIISLVFHFYASQSAAANQSISKTCKAAESSFQQRFQKLSEKYATVTGEKMRAENMPSWSWGTKKNAAVYLSHGFIGTPEEMSAAGRAFHQRGFTVINDIIPGHGLTGDVANKYKIADWRSHISENLQSIDTCFSEIHLVGFSTGALLLQDFLLSHPHYKVRSLTLYSPFFKSRSQFSGFLRTATRFFTPTVSTNHLYCLTRFPDIKVAVVKPNNYLQELPLDMAVQVEQLGEIVFKNEKSLSLPTLGFVSDADLISDPETAREVLQRSFSNLNLVRFQEQYAPHHVMVREVSTFADQVIQQTVDFVLQN